MQTNFNEVLKFKQVTLFAFFTRRRRWFKTAD